MGLFSIWYVTCKAWSVTYPGRGRVRRVSFRLNRPKKLNIFFFHTFNRKNRDGVIHRAIFVFQCHFCSASIEPLKTDEVRKTLAFFHRYSFTVVFIDSHTLPLCSEHLCPRTPYYSPKAVRSGVRIYAAIPKPTVNCESSLKSIGTYTVRFELLLSDRRTVRSLTFLE